ncbi:hypothetical protein BH11PLA2_BH11PLA2_18810 [soil metagenome]
MQFRPSFEYLETRDNPSGPELIDPIGIPLTSAPPAKVPGEEVPAPVTTVNIQPIDATIQKIIDTTIAAINQGW